MSLSGLILKLAGWKVDITQPDYPKALYVWLPTHPIGISCCVSLHMLLPGAKPAF